MAVSSRPQVSTILHGFSARSSHGSLGFAAAYLITSTTPAGARFRILFDCGQVSRRRALVSALAAEGLAVTDVDALVLSHSHYDHLQNADLFVNAQIFLHRSELSRLARRDRDDPVTPPWTGAILAGLDVREVEGGRELAAGVRTLALPGHTQGSLGLVVETDSGRAVLTGDAVSTRDAYLSHTCTVVHFDESSANASIDLIQESADILYPGHGRPFRAKEPFDYLGAEVHLGLR
jgi:glyoxylase-like metal-dependent hydrolase (beta-lactamase superfamily II)